MFQYYDLSETYKLTFHSKAHSVPFIRINVTDILFILNTQADKGNIFYLVYGYINRGRHEGMNGIQVMKYDAKSQRHGFFYQNLW